MSDKILEKIFWCLLDLVFSTICHTTGHMIHRAFGYHFPSFSPQDLGKHEEAVRDVEKLCQMDRGNREYKQMLRDAKIELKKSKRKDYYKGKASGLRRRLWEEMLKILILLRHESKGLIIWYPCFYMTGNIIYVRTKTWRHQLHIGICQRAKWGTDDRLPGSYMDKRLQVSSNSFFPFPASFFLVLGVGKDATDEEIKKGYRKRALVHHPDRHTQAEEVTIWDWSVMVHLNWIFFCCIGRVCVFTSIKALLPSLVISKLHLPRLMSVASIFSLSKMSP